MSFPKTVFRWLGPLLAIIVLATSSQSAEFRLGAAAVSINPPLGIALAGYYHERGNEGVLDDIFAKATVLDDGQTRAAIVVCDLISMPQWIVAEARQIIESQTGIPGTNVIIAATHTHTAPVLFREWSRDDSDGGGTPISKNYSRTLPKLIAEAVAAANEKRQPVRVSVGKESESRLANNRRFWMRDGTVGWNPGKLNSQIVRPAGPIDPEVGVFYAETAAEKPAPLLTFVNYAMHPDTTGGTRISADYPGALSRALALYKGTGHAHALRQRHLREHQPHRCSLGGGAKRSTRSRPPRDHPCCRRIQGLPAPAATHQRRFTQEYGVKW